MENSLNITDSKKQRLDICPPQRRTRKNLKRDFLETSFNEVPTKKARKKLQMRYNKIKTLCPSSTNWKIHGKVSNKDKQLREMQNGCKLFAFVLTDEGASIDVCAFGEEAKKFHPMFQNEQWITIAGGVVKKASNEKYNTINHKFQITLRSQSQIEPDSNNKDADQAKEKKN